MAAEPELYVESRKAAEQRQQECDAQTKELAKKKKRWGRRKDDDYEGASSPDASPAPRRGPSQRARAQREAPQDSSALAEQVQRMATHQQKLTESHH